MAGKVLLALAVLTRPSAAWRVDDRALGFVSNVMGGVIGVRDDKRDLGKMETSGSDDDESSFSEDSGGDWHLDGGPEAAPLPTLPGRLGRWQRSGGGRLSGLRTSPVVPRNGSMTTGARSTARAVVSSGPGSHRSRRVRKHGGRRYGGRSGRSRGRGVDYARRSAQRRARDFARGSLRLRILRWATVHMEVTCEGLEVTCDLTAKCKPVSCTRVINDGEPDFTLKRAKEFLRSAEDAWSASGGAACKVLQEVEDEGTSCRQQLFPATGGE